MLKSILKTFFTLLFIAIIVAGIVAAVYYFSPEINPGEYGVVYKVYGKDKGFTGKILSPGKYYYFLSGLIPGLNKVYKIKIKPEYKKYHVKAFDGTELDLELVYTVDKRNIEKFLENSNSKEIDKILNIYIKSAVDDAFLKFSISDMVKDDFNKQFINNVKTLVNNNLKFFGLQLTKINLLKIKFSPEKQEILAKLQANKLALEKLKIEAEKKLKEEQALNKVKLEKLNFLLKKAEIEKEIAKKNIEKQNIYWEAQKKRLQEEIEILSKPGGENAMKLEAIRIIVDGLKNPEKANKASQIVDKILNH